MQRLALMITPNLDKKNYKILGRTPSLLKISILFKKRPLLPDWIMLLLMETLDAWWMELDSLWLQWISSNWRVENLPTSSMWEEVPMLSRWRRPFKSWVLTLKWRQYWLTSLVGLWNAILLPLVLSRLLKWWILNCRWYADWLERMRTKQIKCWRSLRRKTRIWRFKLPLIWMMPLWKQSGQQPRINDRIYPHKCD